MVRAVSYPHLDVYKRQVFTFSPPGKGGPKPVGELIQTDEVKQYILELSLIHIWHIAARRPDMSAAAEVLADGRGIGLFAGPHRDLVGCLLYTSRCV